VSYTPTKRDEFLLRNGEDFVGTMIFARRSIGMALCYAELAEPINIVSEQTEFWHEYSTAMLWLNIASERLRDYFLMAKFGLTNKKYVKANAKRGAYAAPFEEALEETPGNKKELLSTLVAIAKIIQDHRHSRNVIVHEIASQAAQRSVSLLHEQRIQAGNKPPKTSTPISDFQKMADANSMLKVWYEHLVKASSLVFEFEYFNRPKTP
jgi:hypothetical protein